MTTAESFANMELWTQQTFYPHPDGLPALAELCAAFSWLAMSCRKEAHNAYVSSIRKFKPGEACDWYVTVRPFILLLFFSFFYQRLRENVCIGLGHILSFMFLLWFRITTNGRQLNLSLMKSIKFSSFVLSWHLSFDIGAAVRLTLLTIKGAWCPNKM